MSSHSPAPNQAPAESTTGSGNNSNTDLSTEGGNAGDGGNGDANASGGRATAVAGDATGGSGGTGSGDGGGGGPGGGAGGSGDNSGATFGSATSSQSSALPPRSGTNVETVEERVTLSPSEAQTTSSAPGTQQGIQADTVGGRSTGGSSFSSGSSVGTICLDCSESESSSGSEEAIARELQPATTPRSEAPAESLAARIDPLSVFAFVALLLVARVATAGGKLKERLRSSQIQRT